MRPHRPDRQGARLAMNWADRFSASLQRQWWRRSPSLWVQALRPLAGLAQGLARAHRWWVAPADARERLLPVPVIVVGNLIVGGAGKTPTVIALARWLVAEAWCPGVISRGHGRRGTGCLEVQGDALASQTGDEPLLIRRRTGVPVVVGQNRLAAARALLASHPEVNLLIADDGLQHWRLPRDLQ